MERNYVTKKKWILSNRKWILGLDIVWFYKTHAVWKYNSTIDVSQSQKKRNPFPYVLSKAIGLITRYFFDVWVLFWINVKVLFLRYLAVVISCGDSLGESVDCGLFQSSANRQLVRRIFKNVSGKILKCGSLHRTDLIGPDDTPAVHTSQWWRNLQK
jgi:hypothetical protein